MVGPSDFNPHVHVTLFGDARLMADAIETELARRKARHGKLAFD